MVCGETDGQDCDEMDGDEARTLVGGDCSRTDKSLTYAFLKALRGYPRNKVPEILKGLPFTVASFLDFNSHVTV